jgi:pimeloyl-ACP methyl ester carboxylesterase
MIPRIAGRLIDVMVTETDIELPDGRTLHAYSSGSGGLTVMWHHGTPNIGAPPEPLFDAAARAGIRWVSYDRPGYGGSTAHPGRNVASAAADVASIADALGIGQFAVLGHSGGGPHALACAALLPGRVLAAVSAAGPAPYGAAGLDWLAGFPSGIERALEAACLTTPWPPTPRGVSSPRRLPSRSCSCTGARTGWCRPRTPSG